jgi:hypothetical protein
MKRFHLYLKMAATFVVILAIGFVLGRATVFFHEANDTTLAQLPSDQPSMRGVDSEVGARAHVPVFGTTALAFDFAVPIQGESVDDAQVFSFFMGMSR